MGYEWALINSKLYIPGDEQEIPVLEPELRVVLEVRRRPKVRGWRGWLVPAVGVTRGASAFAYPAIIDCLPRV